MKVAAIISSIAAAVPALAFPSARDTGVSGFTGIAIHSGSPIHLSSVAASDSAFWLWKPTTSYCPSSVQPYCPSGNQTIFTNGNNTLGLSVEVPGGQQVYVAADGSLGFTQAHSALIPTGASTTGFSKGSHVEYKGSDFLACPQNGTYYKVYAAAGTNSTTSSSCIGFAFRPYNASAVGAWQYA